MLGSNQKIIIQNYINCQLKIMRMSFHTLSKIFAYYLDMEISKLSHYHKSQQLSHALITLRTNIFLKKVKGILVV